MSKNKGTVETPMGDGYGKAGASPTGKVCTDGKHSSVALPERTMGKDSIPEVHYDENGGLPSATIRSKD